MKRISALLLSLVLLLSAFGALADPQEMTVSEIEKYGNLRLSIPGSEFLNAGFAYGDIVTVALNGQTFDMPVGSNYSDVDQGSMIFRVVIKPDTNEDYTLIAINMGDLATTAGIAVKEKTEAAPGYIWHLNEGVEEPVPVTVSMKTPGGYYNEWVLHQLVRSENRADYPHLTDEEFANFRCIETTGIGSGKLYRSSSPVNPEIARNTYADKAAEAAGVRTFINLADNEETMKGYEGFADTYYSRQNILPLNLGVDFAAEDFRAGLANGIRFIASNEGPYLIHCTEGKDRAGFTSAVLESLLGATADEVIADYMVTYYNYYGVQPGTEQYDIVAGSNICKTLAAAFGVSDIRGTDLAAEAEAYLMEIGLTAEEIAQVRANLGN